jgi:hypothetical protein
MASFEVCEEELPDLNDLSKNAVAAQSSSIQSTASTKSANARGGTLAESADAVLPTDQDGKDALGKPMQKASSVLQRRRHTSDVSLTLLDSAASFLKCNEDNVLPADVFQVPSKRENNEKPTGPIMKKRPASAMDKKSSNETEVPSGDTRKRATYSFEVPAKAPLQREARKPANITPPAEACSRTALSIAEVANRVIAMPPKGHGEYDICLPVGKEGLLVNIGHLKGDSGPFVFLGYRRLPGGTQGPAETLKLFRRPLDRLLTIDGISLHGKSHSEMLDMLRKSISKSVVYFRVMDAAIYASWLAQTPSIHAPPGQPMTPAYATAHAPTYALPHATVRAPSSYMVSPGTSAPIAMAPPAHAPAPAPSYTSAIATANTPYLAIAPNPHQMHGPQGTQYKYSKRGRARGSYTSWEERYVQLLEFRKSSGHFNVPKDEGGDLLALARWVIQQRHSSSKKMRSKRELAPYQKDRLVKLISVGIIAPQGVLIDTPIKTLTPEDLEDLLEINRRESKNAYWRKRLQDDAAQQAKQGQDTSERKAFAEGHSRHSSEADHSVVLTAVKEEDKKLPASEADRIGESQGRKRHSDGDLDADEELSDEGEQSDDDGDEEVNNEANNTDDDDEEVNNEANNTDDDDEEVNNEANNTVDDDDEVNNEANNTDDDDEEVNNEGNYTDEDGEEANNEADKIEDSDKNSVINSSSIDDDEDDNDDDLSEGAQSKEKLVNGVPVSHRKWRSSFGGKHWLEEEDEVLLRNSHLVGKWTELSKLLAGRSASSVRNHWKSLSRRLAAGKVTWPTDVKTKTEMVSKSTPLAPKHKSKKRPSPPARHSNGKKNDGARATKLDDDKEWDKNYEALRTFRAIYGHCRAPEQNPILVEWCLAQCQSNADSAKGLLSNMTHERFKQLDELSFWESQSVPEQRAKISGTQTEKKLLAKTIRTETNRKLHRNGTTDITSPLQCSESLDDM